MSFKYTLYFNKTGRMTFLSHLDLLRLFERALRVAKIRIEYTEGFHPHPKIIFAQPLSLGYIGKNEIVDLTLKEDFRENEILERLNKVLPDGISILNVEKSAEAYGNFESRVEAAEYKIWIPLSDEEESQYFINRIDDFVGQEKIEIEKRTKKTKKTGEMKLVDIKPSILKLTGCNDETNVVELSATLDCGSKSNLSPELLIKSLLSFLGLDVKRSEIDVSRESLIFSHTK